MSSYSSVQKLFFDRKQLSTLRKAWEVEDEKFVDTMGLLMRTHTKTRDETLEEIATIRDAEMHLISVFTAMVSVLVLMWLMQPVFEEYFEAFLGNMVKKRRKNDPKKNKQHQQQPKGSSSAYSGMLQSMTPNRMMEVQQHQKRQQQKQKQQPQQRRQLQKRKGGLWGLIKSLFRYIFVVFAYMKESMKTFPSWSMFTGWGKIRKSNADMYAVADREKRRKEQRLNELMREYKRASLMGEFQSATERLNLELGVTAPLTRVRRLQDRLQDNEKRRRARSQPPPAVRPTTPVPEMITPNRASSNRARVEVMKGNENGNSHGRSSRSDAGGAGSTASGGEKAHSSANRVRMEMLRDSTPPSETMMQGKTANRVILDRLKSGNGSKSKNVDGGGTATAATTTKKISSSQKIADYDAVAKSDADDEAPNATQENSKMVRFGRGEEDDKNPQKHLLHPDTVKGILHTKPKYNGSRADEKKVNVRSTKQKENRFVPPIRNRLSLRRLRRR